MAPVTAAPTAVEGSADASRLELPVISSLLNESTSIVFWEVLFGLFARLASSLIPELRLGSMVAKVFENGLNGSLPLFDCAVIISVFLLVLSATSWLGKKSFSNA